MQHGRLIVAALAVAVAGGSWAVSHACDRNEKTQASAVTAAHAECTPEMAAQCTPEMAAACAAKKGARTSAAALEHCAGKGAAAASAKGECAWSKNAATASGGACGSKGAKATKARQSVHTTAMVTAPLTLEAVSADGAVHCGSAAKVTAVAAGAGHAGCGSKTTTSAVTAGGPSCGNHSSKATMAHADCDACSEYMGCEEEINAHGATTQVVPLKNGVMFVYTADNPAKVRAVQSALARRGDRMAVLASMGDKARLCPECREMRGAAASGKLTREVVNIEGGCLTMVTSTDTKVVAKIHALAGLHQASARVKS